MAVLYWSILKMWNHAFSWPTWTWTILTLKCYNWEGWKPLVSLFFFCQTDMLLKCSVSLFFVCVTGSVESSAILKGKCHIFAYLFDEHLKNCLKWHHLIHYLLGQRLLLLIYCNTPKSLTELDFERRTLNCKLYIVFLVFKWWFRIGKICWQQTGDT